MTPEQRAEQYADQFARRGHSEWLKARDHWLAGHRSRDAEVARSHDTEVVARCDLSSGDQIANPDRNDVERIDWLELVIRDGSYASILNDIIATCEHAYSHIGKGPALRAAIDAARAALSGQKEHNRSFT